MNDVDDVMPYAGGNEGWDLVATAATAKFGRVAGTGGTNSIQVQQLNFNGWSICYCFISAVKRYSN